jgi:NAD(P)-dependent dehydrogenase (short-subunit alcohol dehydrogenase family)
MNQQKTALIIGASRGLGWGLAREYLRRGWRVVATVRAGSQDTPLHALRKDYPDLEIEVLDITLPEQIAALRARCAGRRFDLMFVNAGVSNDPNALIGDVSTDEFMRVMLTNALAPMRVVERLGELVGDGGAIALMSSELGSVAGNVDGGWEAYRASKAALNSLMRSWVARHQGDGRSFFVVAPGWVRTEMGGADAPLDIDTSIPGVVDTLERRGGSGGLAYVNYRDEVLPW